MKILYKIALISAATLGFIACNKKNEAVRAVVINTGDITNVGCGYLLVLEDSGLVKPEYLPSAYQNQGMKVMVKYDHLGIMDTCNYGSKIYDRAHILEIEQIRER